MARPFRFSIGARSINKSMTPAQSGYVSYMRNQFKELEEDFGHFVSGINSVAPQAVGVALNRIFERSQTYVPVRKGDLKKSGFVEVTQNSKGVTGRVGYAKGGTPTYALIVHENLETFHFPPTQAKFLERAVDELFFTVQSDLVKTYERKAKEITGTKVKFKVKGGPSKAQRMAAMQLDPNR